MHIRNYQKWLHEWDAARTWDRTLPSHTLLHALEELGEVSRLVQMIEGYRDPGAAAVEEVRDRLALELSDLQVMIFKVAYLCGVDMEEAMQRGMTKADARFPDASRGPAELADYWKRFHAYLRSAGLTPLLDDAEAPDEADAPDREIRAANAVGASQHE